MRVLEDAACGAPGGGWPGAGVRALDEAAGVADGGAAARAGDALVDGLDALLQAAHLVDERLAAHGVEA